MNNNYRLQLRHGSEEKKFSTRDDVFAYIDGKLQYGSVSLLPYEPILFYYGEVEKNTIIIIGLPEGELNNGKPYFIIDTAKLKEQIEIYYETIEELKDKNTELQNAIKAEIEERKVADEIEKDNRINSDEQLQNAIDFTKDDIKSIIDACGLIYNEKLPDGRVSYEPDLHDEIIRDARDITDAIDKVSKFVSKISNELKISVENTDTVNLTMSQNTKGNCNIITADVNIAGTEGLSKKSYDNNIIGKTIEGIYASASLETSATNPNKLIFKTSGYIDGSFKVDAFETEVDLAGYNGDNGKNTGITVNVDKDENKISAELNLSTLKNNILKLVDGEYIVEGSSKNITYKDGTVFSSLNEQSKRIEDIEDAIEFVQSVDVKPSDTDTVSTTVDKSSKGDFVVGANVRLSNDKSIIVSNGGLKADVSASFKKGTSTLFINVGNNEYAIDLSDLAVSVLKSAKYDSVTEELVLEFIVGDTTKTVRVPVGTLIHDIEVDDTDTVDMTLKSVSGGPNLISADVKVDKTHSDNIITVTSNGLYVAKAYITEAVNDEATERKEAENELKSKITEVSQLANDNKDAIKNEATTARAAEKVNADAIAQEVKDARAAEKANADAISENKTAIKANEVAIGAEEGRAKAAEQANATAITAEETRAKAAEVKNANNIDAEITRATEKEADLLEKIGANTEKITENKTAIASEVDRATKAEKAVEDKTNANDAAIKAESERAKLAEQANATAIANENSRATAAEVELKADVDKNKTDIADAKATADQVKLDLSAEIVRATSAEGANTSAINSEKERATNAELVLKTYVDDNLSNKLNATEAQVTYATKEELQNVKDKYATKEDLGEVNSQVNILIENNKDSIDNIDFRFNNTTSELIYTDKNGKEHPFKLYGASLVKEGHFDPTTNSIVLTIENSGVESYITIPVSELLSDLSGKIEVNAKAIEDINDEIVTLSKKWDVNSSSSVELTKTNDILSAKVLIASGTRQAIQLNENGLFASKDLQDSTCVFGDEGTISGQDAISKLLHSTAKFSTDLEKISGEVEKGFTSLNDEVSIIKTNIFEINTEVQNEKFEISKLKQDVQSNKEGIINVNEKVELVENSINSLQNRISVNESDISTIKNTMLDLSNTVNSIKETVNLLTAPDGQLANIMNEINNIKNNLIGTKDGSVAGSVWYELNNMVDAGTF